MTSLAQPAQAARGHFFGHELESFPNDLDVFPNILFRPY
jgi:hypothetical protein